MAQVKNNFILESALKIPIQLNYIDNMKDNEMKQVLTLERSSELGSINKLKAKQLPLFHKRGELRKLVKKYLREVEHQEQFLDDPFTEYYGIGNEFSRDFEYARRRMLSKIADKARDNNLMSIVDWTSQMMGIC